MQKDRYHEILDDEAIADIAFKVFGKTMKDVFLEACHAVFIMQTDISLLDGKNRMPIELEASSAERLLYNVLSEILFYKDAELFFPCDLELTIIQNNDKWTAEGEFIGSIFNRDIHTIGNDVKAITFHDFTLKQNEDSTWEAYVLVDI